MTPYEETLKTYYKDFHERKRYLNKRNHEIYEKHRTHAATKIQKHFRGMLGRRYAIHLKYKPIETKETETKYQLIKRLRRILDVTKETETKDQLIEKMQRNLDETSHGGAGYFEALNSYSNMASIYAHQ